MLDYYQHKAMRHQPLVVLLLISLGSCFVYGADKSLPKTSTPLTFQSTLFVQNDVEVKSRLTGIITKIAVDRGSQVAKGDVLAELRNDDLALEIKKAEVSRKESEAEFKRAESLHEQKLLSDSEFDAKRLAYEQSDADLELAKVNYDKSIIRAPFRGVVVELFARLGQRVVEDESAPLFRIAALEPLLARIFVPEEQLASFKIGDRAEFIPSTASSLNVPARVHWISPVIDAASGTSQVIVQVLVGENDHALRPGASGTIKILPGQAPK